MTRQKYLRASRGPGLPKPPSYRPDSTCTKLLHIWHYPHILYTNFKASRRWRLLIIQCGNSYKTCTASKTSNLQLFLAQNIPTITGRSSAGCKNRSVRWTFNQRLLQLPSSCWTEQCCKTSKQKITDSIKLMHSLVNPSRLPVFTLKKIKFIIHSTRRKDINTLKMQYELAGEDLYPFLHWNELHAHKYMYTYECEQNQQMTSTIHTVGKNYLTCSKSEKYFSFHSFRSRKTFAISSRLIRRPSDAVDWPDFCYENEIVSSRTVRMRDKNKSNSQCAKTNTNILQKRYRLRLTKHTLRTVHVHVPAFTLALSNLTMVIAVKALQGTLQPCLYYMEHW